MKLVPLQKGVSGERFECGVFRKYDLTTSSDAVRDYSEDTSDASDAKETSSHTLEELKQINHQLYKYSLKHVLNSR